jgi:hypothetical protein
MASSGLYNDDLIGLGALGALDHIELDLVTLTKGLVAILEDGGVVDKQIGPVLPTDETITLCIVKPLDDAFVLSHDLPT